MTRSKGPHVKFMENQLKNRTNVTRSRNASRDYHQWMMVGEEFGLTWCFFGPELPAKKIRKHVRGDDLDEAVAKGIC